MVLSFPCIDHCILFVNIIELICSFLSPPHINYFIIYTSYIFYKFALEQLYTVEAK